jgi:hypothetical protein
VQVDVTTEETDASGAQLNLADNGARAVIGGSSYDWYGSGAGGVAYVNTFGNTYYDPGARQGGGLGCTHWRAPGAQPLCKLQVLRSAGLCHAT